NKASTFLEIGSKRVAGIRLPTNAVRLFLPPAATVVAGSKMVPLAMVFPKASRVLQTPAAPEATEFAGQAPPVVGTVIRRPSAGIMLLKSPVRKGAIGTLTLELTMFVCLNISKLKKKKVLFVPL